MSTWSRYDNPWDSMSGLWTWEKQPIEVTADFMWVIESGVDSHYDIVEEATFPMRHQLDFVGNYTTHVEAELRAKSDLVTVVNGNFNLPEVFGMESHLEECSGVIAQYSVSLGSDSGLGTSDNLTMGEVVGFLAEAGLDTIPGFLYYINAELDSSTEVAAIGVGIFEHGMNFQLDSDIYSVGNLSMNSSTFFGMESLLEYDLYSWGRPTRPEVGNWYNDNVQVGSWKVEPPLTGDWKREGDI